jgi:hypothetical protein
VAHYNSLLYEMLTWEEYAEFDEELAEIRGWQNPWNYAIINEQ